MHAYYCEDVVAEEKRVLTMLRLVAGTEHKGAGKECFKLSVEDAIAAAASKSPLELEALARKIIMEHVFEGVPLREFIAEAGEHLVRHESPINERMSDFHKKIKKLDSIGIHLCAGMPFAEVVVNAFGTVIDVKKLHKAIPELKPLQVAYPGLALY